ncbi:hypothetical protein Q5P01_008949 [Channa striata]|uniref:Small integral membrane protein 32 n=1 Tax=Channa striata TaxID=64152 RepID=A0AA88N1L7_CHASR|nr:hypothetical protein Q5P01_008949 [Channa striata]
MSAVTSGSVAHVSLLSVPASLSVVTEQIGSSRPAASPQRVLGGAGAERAGDAEECGAGILVFPAHLRNSSQPTTNPRTRAMLRQILLNSTDAPDFDLVLMAQSSTHAPSSLNASHGGSVNVAALLRPTTGRGGGGLREGELHKPDLITYIVMCLLLFLLVLLIVFFINCQLRNSFFASMPYDRSLREARTSYK